MTIIKDSQSEIVIKQRGWFYVVAWANIPFGLLLFIGYLPASLADPTSDTWVPVGFGLLFILLGIWLVGMTTKVTFDKPPGYVTVSRGNHPVFLWFLRIKRISREEAESVSVCSRDPWWWTHEGSSMHEVRSIAKSGKEVILFNAGWEKNKAIYVAKKIKDWAKKAVVTN